MILGRRIEIQPTTKQEQMLLQHAGNARWAYNWGLARHREAYARWVAEGKPKRWAGWPNAIRLHRELNALKKVAPENGGVPWMYEASKSSPQEALRDLDRAFANFRAGRARFPQFKSRNRGIGGFRLTGVIRVDGRAVRLPRLGRLRVKPGERGYVPPGEYGRASVMECAGRWFVSVVVAGIEEVESNGKSVVGVDVGVVRLATLSDGTVFENLRAVSRGARRVRRCQKEVSRKQKGSANRTKARGRLACAHARVRNVRRNHLHQVTTAIAKSHGVVVIEDLRMRNMLKGGGARKRGLNRALSDASFGEFRRLLEYKGRRYGCAVVVVNPAYTSQRCSACGCVDRRSRRTQSEFVCVSCGVLAHADLNAALNILAAGSCPEAVNACGVDGSRAGLRASAQLAWKQESVVA